jgi:hypothetical protein
VIGVLGWRARPGSGFNVAVHAIEFHAGSIDAAGAFTASGATLAPPADGVIDGAGLALLLGTWGAEPSCANFVENVSLAPAPDGVVDGADLAVLLGAWGPCE